MELSNSNIVVTGAGSGIGAALCKRFAEEGPRAISLVDLDAVALDQSLQELAQVFPQVKVTSHQVDVSKESEVIALIHQVTETSGTIDLFCGNAGIGTALGLDAPNQVWQSTLDVNLMAHVYAARALMPAWLDRGRGYYLLTASAAGLLTNLGDAPYSVSKHGAVALAEWISITYGDRGIGVSCLCPQGVRTPLLFPEMKASVAPDSDTASAPEDAVALAVVRAQRILEPSEVAESVVAALATEQFLILPHEEVAAYEQARASNRERWLSAMRRLQAQISGG
ncbi:MAG: SDR family NAD(P)-dependent oxidoreductase [Actinobacteria bacterium]|nr:SDR family NAD(P)-dependent oxidoreductase [Actinomycetota bacterium]